MEDDASPLPMAKRRKTMPAPKTPPDSFPPFSDEFSIWCLRLRQPVPLIVIDDTPDHSIPPAQGQPAQGVVRQAVGGIGQGEDASGNAHEQLAQEQLAQEEPAAKAKGGRPRGTRLTLEKLEEQYPWGLDADKKPLSREECRQVVDQMAKLKVHLKNLTRSRSELGARATEMYAVMKQKSGDFRAQPGSR